MELNRDKWQNDFEKQLMTAEKSQTAKIKSYYQTEYNKGVESFLSQNQTTFQLLFQEQDLLKLYRNLYLQIGMRFANWYAKNFDKYLTKGVNPNQYASQWENIFASFGSAVGAQRVTLVSGTAKQTLIKVTQNLLSDPDFMSVGNIEKGRILRNQFNKYSKYQAERLVRTEATNAANFATMESATTIFPGAQMQKEWIASFDDRTRSSHSEAGASDPVDYNQPFMVGGSFMMFPGDPAGPAAEVINCRCSVAPFPKQNAQSVGGITDINLGLGGAQSTGFGLADVVSAINTTLSVAGETVVSSVAKTINEAKKMLTDLFEKNGFKINKTTFSRSLTVEQYNLRLQQLEKLFDEYNFDRNGNILESISLKNNSSKNSFGWIKRKSLNSDLVELNLGDRTDTIANRTFNLFLDKFDTRFKSAIDAKNNYLATLVHEMGHVLTRSGLRTEAAFFEELKVVRKLYFEELLKYQRDYNFAAHNKIFLGRYASKNIDEFLAETFTEYKLNSNPSKYSKLVGELIDKYYKK